MKYCVGQYTPRTTWIWFILKLFNYSISITEVTGLYF
jgi:hypothetical protein